MPLGWIDKQISQVLQSVILFNQVTISLWLSLIVALNWLNVKSITRVCIKQVYYQSFLIVSMSLLLPCSLELKFTKVAFQWQRKTERGGLNIDRSIWIVIYLISQWCLTCSWPPGNDVALTRPWPSSQTWVRPPLPSCWPPSPPSSQRTTTPTSSWPDSPSTTTHAHSTTSENEKDI